MQSTKEEKKNHNSLEMIIIMKLTTIGQFYIRRFADFTTKKF